MQATRTELKSEHKRCEPVQGAVATGRMANGEWRMANGEWGIGKATAAAENAAVAIPHSRFPAVKRLRRLKQDPARRNELVPADLAVAAVGVGEGGGGDQQAAGARGRLALLEQEFGFALREVVVEIQRPQQEPMQRVGAGIARIKLAMPTRVAALVGGIPLHAAGSGACVATIAAQSSCEMVSSAIWMKSGWRMRLTIAIWRADCGVRQALRTGGISTRGCRHRQWVATGRHRAWW